MRELVPRLLLDRLAEGADSGTLSGAAVQVDLVGFTTMADSLSRHGAHGAEVLAGIVGGVLEPVIDAVYEQAGFVANFTGDGLVAAFGDPRRALAAALAISAAIEGRAVRSTPYGSLQVQAKLGVGAGDVRWRVLHSADGRRATYAFSGGAMEAAVAAEAAAGRGELILHPSMHAAAAGLLAVRPCGEGGALGRVEGATGALPDPVPLAAPASAHPLAEGFHHRGLLEWRGPGEFRPVVPVFVGLPVGRLSEVVADVFALQDRHGGRLAPIEIADKGCVAYLTWGAPVGYEGDVERALAFLHELRRRHPGIRAGAAHGTAWVGFVGSAIREEFVAYGTHVNLAARLMATAAAGEVRLAPALAERAREAFDLRSAGSLRLKGLAGPVEAHSLVGARDRRLGHERPLAGRAGELHALESFLTAVRGRGGAGAAVVVGEPGIGKSRLVDEASARWTAGTGAGRWLAAAADPVWREPLYPLRQIAADLLDQSPRATRAANEERFDAALAALAAGAGPSVAQELEARRPFAGALVGLHWTGSAWEQADPAARFRGALDAFLVLMRALCRRGPVVVRLEDAQWADAETVGFLPELLAALAGEPFALLATRRSQHGASPLAGVDPELVIELGPLTGPDLALLADRVLGGPVDPAALEWLARRTDGNPFFAEQTLLHLRERGDVHPGSGGLALVPREEPPARVGEVVVARLDDLPVDVRAAVQSAAVLGPQADRRELERMLAAAGMEGARVEAAVDLAAERDLWSRSGDRLRFAHALVREAAYEMLLIASRRRLHAAAAEAIEHEAGADMGPHLHRLAHHHAEAGAVERAVWFERAAAERALGTGAYRQAAECAESGLALLARIPDGAERRRDELSLSLALGAGRLVSDGQSAATTRAAYERAAALSRDAPETAEGFRALFGLRTYYLFAGEHATSLRMAEQSLALARRLDDDDLLVQADLMVANARFWVGDLAAAERHLEALGHRLASDRHATHLVGFAQDPRFTALFPSAMTCWLRGDAGKALALVEEGLGEARELEHGFSEAVVLQVLAFLHCLEGRAEPARDAAHELVRIATEERFPVYAAIGSIQAGWAEARMGAPDEGLERMATGLRELRAGGVAVGETLIGALLADARLTAGRREPGRAAAEEALAVALRRRELAFQAELERLRAEALPAGDEQARVRAAALATARRQGAYGIERRLRAVTGGAVA